MITIRKWLEKNREKYQGKRMEGMEACVRDLSFGIKSVQNKAASIWPVIGKEIVPITSEGLTGFLKSKNKNSNDIMHPDDFIGGIDIVKHIMDFLNTEVKDGYIEDEKLRRHFEIGASKWNEIKRLPIWGERMFSYVKANGQKLVVWSSKKGIERARSTISMTRYEL